MNLQQAKQIAEKCTHNFELQRTDIIPQSDQNPTPATFFYKKVAYVVCVKCGEVKQQDI